MNTKKPHAHTFFVHQGCVRFSRSSISMALPWDNSAKKNGTACGDHRANVNPQCPLGCNSSNTVWVLHNVSWLHRDLIKFPASRRCKMMQMHANAVNGCWWVALVWSFPHPCYVWEDWAQPVKQKLKSGFLGNHMPLCGPWHRPKQSFSSLPKNANIYIDQNYLGTFKKASKGPGRRCNQSSMMLSCLPACTHTHNSQLIWLVLVGETSMWFEWVGQSNPS